MKVLRSRAPENVRRDALNVAERKAAEGCMPCAEAYLSVAEQNGATAQEIDHTLRRLFARAGALAGVGLAASRVHVGGRLPADRVLAYRCGHTPAQTRHEFPNPELDEAQAFSRTSVWMSVSTSGSRVTVVRM